MGIVEHPTSVAAQRIQISALSTYNPVNFDPAAPELTWFTDGSVLLQDSYWLTSAAFAIYDRSEQLITSGPVRHVSLAAYTAELFALAVAIVIAPARVHIVTDCKTIVDLFAKMIACSSIPCHWSHRPFWQTILCVWKQKLDLCEQPARLE